MYKKSFTETNYFVFLVIFLFGWITYSLKLISINKLLMDLPFTDYPLMILGQGILLIATYQFFKNLAQKSEITFYLTITLMGIIIILITTLEHHFKSIEHFLFFTVFFLSNLLIEAYEICMRSFSNFRISFLKNPHFSILVLFIFESGIVFGSLIGILQDSIAIQYIFIIQLIPFILLIALLRQIPRTPTFNLPDATNEQAPLSKLPFAKFALVLFSIIIIAKNLQGFATILAIKSLKESSSNSLSVIFSRINLIQATIIMLLLALSYKYKPKTTNWTSGFYSLLGIQFISMVILSLFFHPIIVITLGVGRRILDHSIFSDSQNMFDAAIPLSFRLRFKNYIQNTALVSGFFMLGLLSFLVINNHISPTLLWLGNALLILAGIYSTKKLLLIFNRYHLEQIINFQKTKPLNLPEVINSTYALANKKATNANLTLLLVITQKPPLPLGQAIYYTLGEIKAESSIKILQKNFFRHKSEAIRFEIITALHKSKFENKKLFMQKCFFSIIGKNNFPFIDQKLFLNFYNLYPELTIQSLNDQINTDITPDLIAYMFYLNKTHLLIFENKLKEIFNSSNDEIKKLLAAQILYKIAEDQKVYMNYFSQRFSEKKNDFEVILLIIRNLNLINFSQLIEEESSQNLYQNLPLLYTSLSLGSDELAALHIIKKIRIGDPFSLPNHIKEFYYLKNEFRFKIYEAFMNYDATFLDSLIALLTENECDFSADIEILKKEAIRRKIHLAPYEYSFQEH